MGLLDHRRSWHYEVAASPEQCIQAFTEAFTTGGAFMRKASWKVHTAPGSATATYQGRKGLAAAAGILSQTAAQEGDTAVGSEVSFKIDGIEGAKTQCSMALTSAGRSGVGGALGATSDARFIRPYMQAVASQLRKLDPSAKVSSA